MSSTSDLKSVNCSNNCRSNDTPTTDPDSELEASDACASEFELDELPPADIAEGYRLPLPLVLPHSRGSEALAKCTDTARFKKLASTVAPHFVQNLTDLHGVSDQTVRDTVKAHPGCESPRMERELTEATADCSGNAEFDSDDGGTARVVALAQPQSASRRGIGAAC